MKRKNQLVFGAVAIGLIIFAFTDLQISIYLVGKFPTFGKFFENFGEFPMAYIGAFSAVSMIITSKRKKSIANIGFGLLFVLNSAMAAVLVGFNADVSVPVIVFIFLFVLLSSYWLASQVHPRYHDNLRKIAKVGVLLGFATTLVINLIKVGWGRERYRNMINPLEQFTPWYLPQGIASGNEFMSFPSGHAANGAVILWITLLPLINDRLSKLPLEIIAWAWTLATMVSRIVVGAHFASDVLMGMAITYLLFLTLKRKFVKY